MKKIKKILPAVTAAALLCSCSVSSTNEKSFSSETVTELSSEVTEMSDITEISGTKDISDTPEPEGILKAAPDNFPVIDGSTSATALDAAVRAAYLGGFTAEELEPFILHSTTQKSFENLIIQKADAIFSVKISENSWKDAMRQNLTIESIPVAKEAFVFIVNEQNPVKSLTQEQLRDIFTGRITNWSEVGGNDAEIKVYLRNENSGSATYLKDFLGDEEPVSGERVYMAGSMGGITDFVSSYEDGTDSIGISVYSYVDQIEFAEKKPAMIAVDGISPDSETLADNSYPLMSYTYFMYPGTAPKDSEVRKLAEFIPTKKCQDAVEACGYVRAFNPGEVSSRVRTIGMGINQTLTFSGTDENKTCNIALNRFTLENEKIDTVKITFSGEDNSELNGELKIGFGLSVTKDSPYSAQWYSFPDVSLQSSGNKCTAVFEIPDEVQEYIDKESGKMMVGYWWGDSESVSLRDIEISLSSL